MKKKFFSLAILLGVLATFVVGASGCGSKDKDKGKDKSSSTTQTTSNTQENGATTSSSKK